MIPILELEDYGTITIILNLIGIIFVIYKMKNSKYSNRLMRDLMIATFLTLMIWLYLAKSHNLDLLKQSIYIKLIFYALLSIYIIYISDILSSII